MSQGLGKDLTMGEQLSLPFSEGANDSNTTQAISSNVIRYDDYRQEKIALKDTKKREQIINKLLLHAEGLGW